jgi:hypothetical protein
MRDNVQAGGPEDYYRKSITVSFLGYMLNKMKTRFTNLHARTALGLQLVPSIFENITPYLRPPIKRVSGSAPAFDGAVTLYIYRLVRFYTIMVYCYLRWYHTLQVKFDLLV